MSSWFVLLLFTDRFMRSFRWKVWSKVDNLDFADIALISSARDQIQMKEGNLSTNSKGSAWFELLSWNTTSNIKVHIDRQDIKNINYIPLCIWKRTLKERLGKAWAANNILG